MARPRPYEQRILARAESVLQRSTAGVLGETKSSARLEILEASAAIIGGWDIEEFNSAFAVDTVLPSPETARAADELVQQLERQPISPHLALASLASPILNDGDRRRSGAYYSDFRLANFAAGKVAPSLTPSSLLVDPACGSGILLTAAVLAVCGDDAGARREMLSAAVSARDISEQAIRATRLALASVARDLTPVKALAARLLCQDSLLPDGSEWIAGQCEAVVVNPPWERLKVTRHEHLRARGHQRHYGDDYPDTADLPDLELARSRLSDYIERLSVAYALGDSADVDLYQLFIQLSVRLIEQYNGQAALIVPAGVIRSQGSEGLRRVLFGRFSAEITVLDNRAAFFAADSRLKFLVLHLTPKHQTRTLRISHASSTGLDLEVDRTVDIPELELRAIRPDLTVPEVRSRGEWELFRRLSLQGHRLGAAGTLWAGAEIVRELDMSRDRHLFAREGLHAHLPVIEGRMVQQFRCGAKSYVSGTGRRAQWRGNPLGHEEIRPQFYVAEEALPAGVLRRSAKPRVGFCDITGQTNERTMLAAQIPSGVVCGNKVPTITFPDGAIPELPMLLLGVLNSLAFDWVLRRVVTTSVNYFLLKSLPLPALDLHDRAAGRIIAAVRTMQSLAWSDPVASQTVWGLTRAEVDAVVLHSYGVSLTEAEVMLRDFPLLDAAERPIRGETRSTVTRDAVLAMFKEYAGESGGIHRSRLEESLEAGSIPYCGKGVRGLAPAATPLTG